MIETQLEHQPVDCTQGLRKSWPASGSNVDTGDWFVNSRELPLRKGLQVNRFWEQNKQRTPESSQSQYFMLFGLRQPGVLSRNYAVYFWSDPRPICCISNSGLSVNPRPILHLTFYKHFHSSIWLQWCHATIEKRFGRKNQKKIAFSKQSVVFDQHATADIQHGVKSGVCWCQKIL